MKVVDSPTGQHGHAQSHAAIGAIERMKDE